MKTTKDLKDFDIVLLRDGTIMWVVSSAQPFGMMLYSVTLVTGRPLSEYSEDFGYCLDDTAEGHEPHPFDIVGISTSTSACKLEAMKSYNQYYINSKRAMAQNQSALRNRDGIYRQIVKRLKFETVESMTPFE